jgi:hypothetical protein
MTDQRPPQDPPESEDPDAIIELTDVVSSPETDEEDVIELTDVVEEAAEGEEVIELTDVVTPGPEAASAAEELPLETSAEAAVETPEEEPVIELTDMVASPDTEEMPAVGTEEPEFALSEETTDLEDDVDTEPLADRFEPADDEQVMIEAAVEGVEASTSGDLEFAEMDLDIENRKEEGLFDSLGMNMEADLLDDENETGDLDFNLSTQELSDAIDLLDAKLAEEPPQAPPVEEVRATTPEALEVDQLEAALEKVIRKMFAEKIDKLLDDAIERTVAAEIARLKDQLVGDEPPETS